MNIKYPPNKPYPPYQIKRECYIGTKAGKRTDVFYEIELLRDSDFDLEEYFEEQGEDMPERSKMGSGQITLQDILDMAPKNAKPSDIQLSISFPRMCEYYELVFYHTERDLKAEEKEYQKDLKQYEKDLEEYNQELNIYNQKLEEYNDYKKQEEIIDLETKLNKLKNK